MSPQAAQFGIVFGTGYFIGCLAMVGACLVGVSMRTHEKGFSPLHVVAAIYLACALAWGISVLKLVYHNPECPWWFGWFC